MKKIVKFILSGIIIIYSCTEKPERIVESNPERINIHVDALKEVNLSEIADSIYYIELETNDSSLIGRIDRLWVFNNRIYILDKSINRALYIFNMQGKFKLKIDEHGNNFGSYLEIRDAYLDKENNTIEIFDNTLKKQLAFSLIDGSFLYEKKIDRSFLAFEKPNDSTYLLHTNKMNNFEGNQLVAYDILLCNAKGEIVKRYFPYDPDLKTNNISYDLTKVFTRFEDKIYLTKLLVDTLYLYKDQQFIPKYYFDYADRGMPGAYLKLPSDQLFNKLTTKNQYAYAHTVRGFTEDLIYFSFSYQNLSNTDNIGLYYKKSKKTKLYAKIHNDMDGGVFPLPINIHDSNALISIIEPSSIYNKHHKNKLNITQNHFLSKYLNKDKLYDNPVLMITKLQNQ